jgi:glutamyl-Q tRNA(Asp) synthetase
LNALELYGFRWDGPVTYQSTSSEAHHQAVQALLDAEWAYPCGCSRADLAAAPRSSLGIIYPDTCRHRPASADYAIRVRTKDCPIAFLDRLQGRQMQRLESESGDFVILRRDGLVAYHLAVVVDDHLQGITEVVRGIDLLDSTPRQLWLQSLLRFCTPGYCHIPVAVNEAGQKLSKNTGATALPLKEIPKILTRSLAALGQAPPAELESCATDEVWAWAEQHWRIDAMKGMSAVQAPQFTLDELEKMS